MYQLGTKDPVTFDNTRSRESIPPESRSPLILFSGYKLQLYLTGILLAITVGHYSLPAEYHIAHSILQRLYYIPIVWAAFHLGRKGGLIVSAISGILYLPHVIFGWQSYPEYQISQIIEIIIFPIVGLSAGYLFEQKVLSQQQLQSYEKMALFGNLSRSIIRSLKGPLRAVKGILIALEPLERGNDALKSCVEIIRDEVTRIEVVRDDLISLVERKKLRLKKRNLNDLLFEFASQVEVGLAIKGVQIKRQPQNIKLIAQYNRGALLNVLHQLVGRLVENNRSVEELTFYSGQSSSHIWLGASTDQVRLSGLYTRLSDLNSQHYHEYELVTVTNVMNSHFGDAKFRWQDHRMAEFILIFPKKLKLPWYLRDEPLTGTKQNPVRHRRKDDHLLHSK